MEHNTNRMWWTIGALVLGGLLITGFVFINRDSFLPNVSKNTTALFKKMDPDKPYTIVKDDKGYYYIDTYTGDGPIATIPKEIDGKKISYIAVGAFKNKNITGIKFENGFDGSKIFEQDYTWSTPNIKTLELPQGITEIPNYVIWNIPLDSVIVPEGVTTIGSGSFGKSKFVQLPKSLTKFNAGSSDYQPGTVFNVPVGMELSNMYGTGVYIDPYSTNYTIQRY